MLPLFPPRHVYFPSSLSHTSTVILLHGRGSNGPELASELAESRTSSGRTLFEHFPSCRWVFPSARPRWSEEFCEELGEWFDPVLLEEEGRDQGSEQGQGQDRDRARRAGLKESVEHVLRVVEDEARRLDCAGDGDGHGDGDGKKKRRIILGGLSQGMAVALVAMLQLCCAQQEPEPEQKTKMRTRLGGFVGAMGWIPLAEKLQSLLDDGEQEKALGFFKSNFGISYPQHHQQQQQQQQQQETSRESKGKAPLRESENKDSSPFSTPIFLSHGEDDKWVDVSLGKTAHNVLIRLGFQNVSWKSYTGAEGDGHWLKEPEQLDDIVKFLEERFNEGS
ncbi:hypothetical protein VTN00DRAFT_9401 [Thermoascus crustaceus]|uniref:uncharacterized protein n=1 Tax=Thermoascus crustaceus TaxID=5088 RepID=UPI0037433F29